MAKKITTSEGDTVETTGTQPKNTENTDNAKSAENTAQTEESTATALKGKTEITDLGDGFTPVDGSQVAEVGKGGFESKFGGGKSGKTPVPIPEFEDKILKTFHNYPELYIDQYGGTYTVDSPPAFYGTATRYTNPYFKQP